MPELPLGKEIEDEG